MHQSMGEKRIDDFTTKGSNCLRLMIWRFRSDLFWCFWLSCNRNYGHCNIQKNVWCTQNNGVPVTYAARGVVKKMIEVGFKVEKLAGPRGKKMFRARK
jgi:hypothetical protein